MPSGDLPPRPPSPPASPWGSRARWIRHSVVPPGPRLRIYPALRVEMVDADPDGEDVVHIQYYICTDAGGWALWLSCARGDLAAREAALHKIPPFMQES